jgi:four helix bundle protein
MSRIERFEDLEAWKLARALTGLIYNVTGIGNFSRDFALRDQLRRASISIVSNIAEGFERDGDKEFIQFLSMAKGSCGEVRARLYLALDRDYFTQEQFGQLSSKAIELSRIFPDSFITSRTPSCREGSTKRALERSCVCF